uniref:Uncharacterized protein n=1 Tax=Anopheles merus TaxID=30066 RepID=A0A182V5S7_ANOME
MGRCLIVGLVRAMLRNRRCFVGRRRRVVRVRRNCRNCLRLGVTTFERKPFFVVAALLRTRDAVPIGRRCTAARNRFVPLAVVVLLVAVVSFPRRVVNVLFLVELNDFLVAFGFVVVRFVDTVVVLSVFGTPMSGGLRILGCMPLATLDKTA